MTLNLFVSEPTPVHLKSVCAICSHEASLVCWSYQHEKSQSVKAFLFSAVCRPNAATTAQFTLVKMNITTTFLLLALALEVHVVIIQRFKICPPLNPTQVVKKYETVIYFVAYCTCEPIKPNEEPVLMLNVLSQCRCRTVKSKPITFYQPIF